MATGADGEYEVVLENRQITILFFVVVVLCGVFFGLGYIVGRNTMGYIPPAEAAVDTLAGKNGAQASEGITAPAKVETSSPMATGEVTFRQAQEPNQSPAGLQSRPAAADPALHLQVAALSKKEDAQALLTLLKGKGFPAVLAAAQGDRLFRVQVGPLASPRDAEQMKERLEREGFKTITKK